MNPRRPAVQVPQQHRRAGPSNRQTQRLARDGLWLVPQCLANVTGYRGGQHDSEGQSQVGSKRRSGRPGAVRWQPVRNRCLKKEPILTRAEGPSSSLSFRNTTGFDAIIRVASGSMPTTATEFTFVL